MQILIRSEQLRIGLLVARAAKFSPEMLQRFLLSQCSVMPESERDMVRWKNLAVDGNAAGEAKHVRRIRKIAVGRG